MSEINPLKRLYQICVYTSCFPKYDFLTFNTELVHNHVFYVLFLTCATIAGFVYSAWGRCVHLQIDFSIQIADAFANISLSACNIVSFTLCYYIGSKYMNKLSLLYANVEFKSDAKGAGGQNHMFGTVTVIMVHSVLVFLIILDIYVISYHFYDYAIFYYIFEYFQHYCVTTEILFIIFAMKQIRNLVTYIKDKLLDNMNNYLVLPIAEMRESNKGLFTLTGWTKTALNTKANIKDVANVKLAAQQYKDIYLLCYYFNLIFGWPMLFILSVVLFEVIQAMNFIVQYPEDHVPNNVWNLCSRILTATYFYALQTWMILCCDDVTEEVTHFANVIYKQILLMSEVQESLAEQMVLKELVTLWYHISNNKPKFHAGFVLMRRKFVYGSFIGVSSFIAVIVEFNQVVYGHHFKHADE